MALTFEKIVSYTATGGESSVSLNSIPSSYTDLFVTGWLLGSSGTNPVAYMTFNGDTGSNYYGTALYGTGTAMGWGGAPYTGQTQLRIQGTGGTTSTYAGGFRMDILDYTSSKYKSILNLFMNNRSGSGTSQVLVHQWINTSVISSIGINFSGATIAAGSYFDVYGILKA